MACLCAALISFFAPFIFPQHACEGILQLCSHLKQESCQLIYIDNGCWLYISKNPSFLLIPHILKRTTKTTYNKHEIVNKVHKR